MWTEFWDMHSGGEQKLNHAKYFIEGESEEANIDKFKRLFHRDPYNVTCDCCGSDYSVSSSETLEKATAYHRGAKWDTIKKEHVGGKPLESDEGSFGSWSGTYKVIRKDED